MVSTRPFFFTTFFLSLTLCSCLKLIQHIMKDTKTGKQSIHVSWGSLKKGEKWTEKGFHWAKDTSFWSCQKIWCLIWVNLQSKLHHYGNSLASFAGSHLFGGGAIGGMGSLGIGSEHRNSLGVGTLCGESHTYMEEKSPKSSISHLSLASASFALR